MINKEKYLAELKRVLTEAYPTGYTKSQLIGHNSQIRNKMDDYVMKKYGEYYKNELVQLIKEKNDIYTECIEELSI